MLSTNCTDSTNSRSQMARALCCSLLFHLLLFMVLRSSPHFPLVVGSEIPFDLFWLTPTPPAALPVAVGMVLQPPSLKVRPGRQPEVTPTDDADGEEEQGYHEPASITVPEPAVAISVATVAAKNREVALGAPPERTAARVPRGDEIQRPVVVPGNSGKEAISPKQQNDEAKRPRTALPAAGAEPHSATVAGHTGMPSEEAVATAAPASLSMTEKLPAKKPMLSSETAPATSERGQGTGRPPQGENRHAAVPPPSASHTTRSVPVARSKPVTRTEPVLHTASVTRTAAVPLTTALPLTAPGSHSAPASDSAAGTPPAALAKRATAALPASAAAQSTTKPSAPHVAQIPRPAQPAASGAARAVGRRNDPEKPAERSGATIPSLHGDLKLVVVGTSGIKVSISFREYPKARRSKLPSRVEGRRQQKVAPLIAQTGRESQEAVVETAREGVYLFVVESESGEPVKGTFILKVFEDGPRGKTSMIGTRTITGKTVLARILMPEGILWEDDAAFTGIIQDGESTTKFNARSGLQWKEYKY